jgi:hypothetical protein
MSGVVTAPKTSHTSPLCTAQCIPLPEDGKINTLVPYAGLKALFPKMRLPPLKQVAAPSPAWWREAFEHFSGRSSDSPKGTVDKDTADAILVR